MPKRENPFGVHVRKILAHLETVLDPVAKESPGVEKWLAGLFAV